MTTVVPPIADPVAIGSPAYAEALEFLYREARLLDNAQHADWLTLLHPEIEYHMPVRVSRMPKDGNGFVSEMEFFTENFSSLHTRIRRLHTDQAWAEQPASRARHFLTNSVVGVLPGGDMEVLSNLMVTRTRSDLPYDLFTGERRDVLRRGDGQQLLLAHRTYYLDQTVLRAMNLSILF